MSEPQNATYVSRGGLKLAHALHQFAVNPSGLAAADLGCSTGGFTDCLLQSGAANVFSVDTAYGELAWKLRKDPRVVVMERSNALHVAPPELVDLVVIDLSWTPQRLCIPAALAWLKPGGRVISLVKPHYELKSVADAGGPVIELPRGGILDESIAHDVTRRVVETLPALGANVLGLTKSPILGGKAGSKANPVAGSGNAEWLVLLEKPMNAPQARDSVSI